jgi:hypothetical protein
LLVIPAKAGIQLWAPFVQTFAHRCVHGWAVEASVQDCEQKQELDSGFRRNDEKKVIPAFARITDMETGLLRGAA